VDTDTRITETRITETRITETRITETLMTDAAAPEAVGDEDLVAFLASIELAAVHLHAAGARLLITPVAIQASAAFGAHHAAHAAALARLGSGTAPRANQALLSNLSASSQGLVTEQGQLELLYTLEEELAATYEGVLGRLTTTPGLAEAAAILPVECQHAVVLGTILAKPMDGIIPPFQGDGGFLAPNNFPLG
jgi:hypothetical protein